MTFKMRIFQRHLMLLVLFIVRTISQPFDRADISCYTEAGFEPPHRRGCLDAISEIIAVHETNITWPHSVIGLECTVWMEPTPHVAGRHSQTPAHLINWANVRNAAVAILNRCFPHGSAHTGGDVNVLALDRGRHGSGIVEVSVSGNLRQPSPDFSREPSRDRSPHFQGEPSREPSPNLTREPSPGLQREPIPYFRRAPSPDFRRERRSDFRGEPKSEFWRKQWSDILRESSHGLLRDSTPSTSIISSTATSTGFAQRSHSVQISYSPFDNTPINHWQWDRPSSSDPNPKPIPYFRREPNPDIRREP
jgi:hypothetical protein